MRAPVVAGGLTYFAVGAVIATATTPDSSSGQAAFVLPNPPRASFLPKVITPAISSFVEDVLLKSNIPGISMGVVRLNSTRLPVAELAAWGRMTEEGNGNDLSSKVRTHTFPH